MHTKFVIEIYYLTQTVTLKLVLLYICFHSEETFIFFVDDKAKKKNYKKINKRKKEEKRKIGALSRDNR